MEWIEDMVSDMLSAVPDWTPADYSVLRLTVLAMAVDSKQFKKEKAKQLRDALRVGLNRHVAAGSIFPATGKHTDGILRHQRLIGDLALLVMAPLDRESRVIVARAIRDESWALSESYDAWVEHVLGRLK